jgi:hypothetical protein
MPINALPSDQEATANGFIGPACQRRRDVLRETLAAFDPYEFPTRFHQLAGENLRRWRTVADEKPDSTQILVIPGDWGEVTRQLTVRFGACFAALNMANAFFPGGAYGEGAPAQEENMFRRTDCHFQVGPEELGANGRTYVPEVSRLLHGIDGRVYLDAIQPRVCVRGPELRHREDLGYEWLADDDVFPFFELRAAAQDLRDGSAFDASAAQRTIGAIFDTLSDARIRHVVLGAFGCGAFQNPATEVARLFRDALRSRSDAFDVVAFAIYHAGYGPDNFTPFAQAFSRVT